MAEVGIQTNARGGPAADSDKALRYLKASEAAEAAFAAAGYAAAPDGLKTMIASRVNSLTQDIPASSLSSSGGILAVEAASGVSMAMASLTEAQREAIKNGGNIDAASQAKLNALVLGGSWGTRLPGSGFGDDSGGGASVRGSSVRFSDMPGNGTDWMRLPQVTAARDLAMKYNMGWAANNRELMMLGPSAVQALHDVNLKQESYKQLKDVSFKAGEIVSLAKFSKKEHIDANHLSGTVATTVRTLAPKDVQQQRKLDAATGEFAANPNEHTQRKMLDTYAPLANTPEKKAQTYRMTDEMKIKRGAVDAAFLAKEQKNARAQSLATQAQNGVDAAFNSGPAAPDSTHPRTEKPKGSVLPQAGSTPPTRPAANKPDASKPSGPKPGG